MTSLLQLMQSWKEFREAKMIDQVMKAGFPLGFINREKKEILLGWPVTLRSGEESWDEVVKIPNYAYRYILRLARYHGYKLYEAGQDNEGHFTKQEVGIE